MNVNPMAASSGSNATGQTGSLQGANQMFLQLLMAQLKNQSPLDPMDGNQFAGQLVQYNMLDQLTQIRVLLQQAAATPAKS